MMKMIQYGMCITNYVLIVVVTNVQSQIMIQKFMDREYLINNTTGTFSQMEKLCKSNQAIIAPARTKAENEFLFTIRNEAGFGNNRIWIGGDDRNGSDGVYVWSDGTPLTYTNWIGNEPINAGGKEDCMVLEGGTNQWNDISCEEFKLRAICMKFEAPDPRLPYTFVPTRTTIPTTIPTPLLPLRTTTTRPTVSQDPLPSSTRGGQVMSTSEPLSCVECPGSSFPLGFGIGIATGLLLGVILSAGVLAIYCIKNKRKLQRDGGQTVAYNDGIYLTPQGSSSPSNPTQGQSPTEINHYASLGNTLPPQATVYEPLKLYENYKK